MNKLISIIIPTYNRAGPIEGVLFSVIAQTYTNWECIIIDDGSTDNTKEIVQKFIDKDKRFKYLINNRKKGAQGARNTGIIESSGEWICFLDSDDHLLENSIKDRIESWEKEKCREKIALIYGDFVNTKFKKLNENAYQWMIRNMALCAFSVMLVRKQIVFNGYLLDERFPAWQDDDFVFEVAIKFNVLHCGKAVAIFAPNERENSISMSKKRVFDGLSLMISKRKKILLRDGGIGRLILWYLRLLILRIDLFSDRNLNKKKYYIIRKFINLCTQLMRKILLYNFDVIYV